MPGGKATDKSSGRLAQQLFFSEALQFKRPVSPAVGPHPPPPPAQPSTMSDKEQPTTMDRILREITAVSRRIEGMDAAITSLTLETKSMHSDIAGFQSRVTWLEHRVVTLESHMNTVQDRDQDLLYFHCKIMDLEDRSRRENVCFFVFLENEEGPSRPIIASLLRHGHTRQLLQAARTHGPFRMEGYDIHITADYSKDTNDHQKAFLALRPHLRQLEMKYGLFNPVKIWVNKNGVSKDFYDPEDLRLFLDTFLHTSMDTATPARPQDQPKDSYDTPPPGSEREGVDRNFLTTDLEAKI
ncbi:hypothetical protein NDU88_003282 [Pleurodeles waltl]|uniref:Uncharacterized protein n=1 Tax=Pleurodeles waltl TaxID=8319 RepID=A0AAV7VGP8_PLEWA|nr:hypothetical protein NDU88_003282 [Pleurodeles waltl]